MKKNSEIYFLRFKFPKFQRQPTMVEPGCQLKSKTGIGPKIHVHNQLVSRKRSTKAGVTRCPQETDLTASGNVECNACWAVRKIVKF